MWEAWTPVGGRTKYALPLRKALRWAVDRARVEAIGTPLEYLSWTLMGRRRHHPVTFRPRTIPLFFLHQVQTNDVVLALKGVQEPRIVWATSWDRPLPNELGTFRPPQPDAVLAVDHGRLPFILFLEMDRATQKIADFTAGKSRYARFARQPTLLNEAFGTGQFHTLVVVDGETARETTARIDLLGRTARANGFGGVLSLVPFDAVLADPAQIITTVIAAMDHRYERDSASGPATFEERTTKAA